MRQKTTINKTDKLFEGFFQSCDAVAASMGAEGAFAIIANEMGAPTVTKDGVTISKSIFFNNDHKNLGAFFCKQASAKTLVQVGDATTTTLVLAKGIVENTWKQYDSIGGVVPVNVETNKHGEYHFNSKVREGIEIAQKEVEKQLKSISLPAETKDILNIARISANNDETIANLVLEAYEAVGASGTIDVQENYEDAKTFVKLSQGMRFDRGWKSPFLTHENGVFESENVNILVYEGNITTANAQDIATFLEQKRHEPILLVCEHITDDVMLNVEDMHRRKVLNICVVEAPFYAEQRKEILQDLALYTNTEVFIQGTTEKMSWGKASKVIVEQNNTSIIQDKVSDKVSDKLEKLKESLETAAEKDFVQKRISNFEGKAAIIMVGGTVEAERREKKDRVDDSVGAVMSAVEEGIVSGGGSSLVYISSNMKDTFKDEDIQFGYDVVREAILAPYQTILTNAKVGYEQYIEASETLYQGYNVKTRQIENLHKSGVVDSVKGIRVALENAVSVSNLLLNTKVIITQ